MNTELKLHKNVTLGLSMARSLNYTLQSLWLPVVEKVLNSKTDRDLLLFTEHLKTALPKIKKLLEADAENISEGIYPASVLYDENVFTDWARLPLIIADSVRANKQRKSQQNTEFDEEAQSYITEMPEYYKRNFHFQKSGYLSDHSANLYEQQVEILFSGTAQVMRRQILKPLKNHFALSNGEGLKFLELGSGTGSLTKSLALAFPKAQITCLDLSPHYLKKARSQFKSAKNINFIQGMAENIQFKENTFDAVFSCYLFHELPEDVRESVLKEKWRVLKNKGFIGISDSIQKNDDPDLKFALDQFPLDFHEPFYKNYVNKDILKMLESNLGVSGRSEIHFLTKTIYAVKDEYKSKDFE